MAERRMFSKKIIDSARFIKMPASSQALYFHMGIRADDDGVVEGYNVMRMIGATEDDLKVLVAKGFVTILNEDLVAYINDWKEHNLIRADRKVDSVYKNLLLQIVPEVQLLEPKQRSDVKKKQSKEFSGQPMDNQWTTNGQSMDSEMSAQDRLDKDNIGQYNIGKYYIEDVQQAEQSTTKTQKSKSRKFVKPTIEEIRNYCIERKNNISAQYFYDYYEANGWKVGKNSMKDWKATVRNWERRDFYGGRDTNGGNNIQVNPTNSDMSEWGF